MGYQILTDEFLGQLEAEFRSAVMTHGPMGDSHSAYAVILEELDEFWEEVRKKRDERSKAAMLKELVQIAAMAWRAANDLGLLEQPSHIYVKGHDKLLDRPPAYPVA